MSRNILLVVLMLILIIISSIFETWMRNRDNDKMKPYF